MSRIKIEMPERYDFVTEMALRIADINYGGHLGNDAVLALVHEARLRFLKSLGFSEMDAGGAGLIMADAAIVFKSQAFHGDVICIEVGTGELGRAGFDLYYRLTNKAGPKEVAMAKTGLVFFDYAANRVSAMPEAFRNKLAGLKLSVSPKAGA